MCYPVRKQQKIYQLNVYEQGRPLPEVGVFPPLRLTERELLGVAGILLPHMRRLKAEAIGTGRAGHGYPSWAKAASLC